MGVDELRVLGPDRLGELIHLIDEKLHRTARICFWRESFEVAFGPERRGEKGGGAVTERTREIGVRRAIGAKRSQIVGQFLGIALGVALPGLITHFAGMATVVKPWSHFLSVGISCGVGLVFGIYPALRAARLDPISALRHE